MSIRAAAGEELAWSFGLRNAAKKYLTAESFQFKLATAAERMKKKQIFFLEQDGGDSDHVYIRTHLNRYISVDGDGNVHANSDSKTDETELLIEAQPNGTWAIKSKKMGWYIKNSGDPLGEKAAFVSELSEEHLWTVHLAMHPQVCVKNLNRKCYMHLADDGSSLTTDEVIPWGDDATITMHFFDDDGTYGLVAANGKYLTASGALSDAAGKDARFIIVFQGGKVSFKNVATGKFLTAIGAVGTCKATKSHITKDEMFHLEDSFPQLKFTSVNGKKLSIQQGIEVSASSAQTTDNEIFQVEPVGNVGDDIWTIKSCTSKYWSVRDGSVISDAEEAGDSEKFKIEWHGPQVAIKSVANGKYLEQKLNGSIHAIGDEPSEEKRSLYVYEIVNRPRLVLRGEYGFVGTLPSGLLECNKSVPEVYSMHVTKGMCEIKHANGKYWQVSADGSTISCSGGAAEGYTMSLHEDSMMCLMKDGKYFEGFQNGAFSCTGKGPGKSTFFEY
jgi:fascin 1/2